MEIYFKRIPVNTVNYNSSEYDIIDTDKLKKVLLDLKCPFKFSEEKGFENMDKGNQTVQWKHDKYNIFVSLRFDKEIE